MSTSEPLPNPDMRFTSKTHVSYAFGSFFDDFIMTAFAMRVYSFYETELFLPNAMIAWAIIIYGIWNMINDPIVGYLSDKNFKFTRKRGKRFTWFIIMSFPTAIIYLLIFVPVGVNNTQIFLWLLLLICLFDTFFSFWNTNWLAIFPFKFRSQKERTKVAAFQTLLSQIGLTMGMLLPAFFFTYGVKESYINAAIFVMAVCFVAILAMIPGMKQDSTVLEHIEEVESTKPKESYLQTVKFALKEKNFRAYLTAYLGQTVMMTVMLASIPYLVNYVIGAGEDAEFLISAAVLAGGLISVPLWITIGRKYGNRIGYMCGTGLTAGLLVIFFFVSMNYVLVVVCAGLVGFTMGATWSLMYPTFSDVIDEIVIKAKKRNEGIYYGFRTFIGRFSIVIQASTFGIIHAVTNFDPQLATQPGSAVLGIRIHTALIPALFYFLGFLAMWRIYDLKPAKVEQIKAELVELDL